MERSPAEVIVQEFARSLCGGQRSLVLSDKEGKRGANATRLDVWLVMWGHAIFHYTTAIETAVQFVRAN